MSGAGYGLRMRRGLHRCALEGGAGVHQKGRRPRKAPQQQLGRRLEEVAKAVGGSYCPQNDTEAERDWRHLEAGAEGSSVKRERAKGP